MKFEFEQNNDEFWDSLGDDGDLRAMSHSSPSICSPIASIVSMGPPMMMKLKPPGYHSYVVLPVITSGSRDKANAWTWNGDIKKPTLRPSIRTNHGDGRISHLWLNGGICEYLGDSTDGNAGKKLPLLILENRERRDEE